MRNAVTDELGNLPKVTQATMELRLNCSITYRKVSES